MINKLFINRRHQRGLSLIELMIALTIGLILLGALSSIYLSSRQTFRATDNLSRVQENARIAFDTMSRDIRGTAFFGCAGQDGDLSTVLIDSTGVLWDFLIPIYGYEASTSSAWSTTLPTEIASPLGGRDILVTRSIDEGGGPVVTHGVASDDLEIPENSGLKSGDVVVASNCAATTIFQVTSVTTSGGHDSIGHAAKSGTPGNATTDLGHLFSSGELRPVSTKIYYIRNNTSGIPSLYVQRSSAADPEEIAEGIDGMQIVYGVDTDSDYFADSYQTAAQVEAASAWSKVISIRVTLTAISREDSVATAAQSNATNTGTDRRLRKEITTTIALRNRAG